MEGRTFFWDTSAIVALIVEEPHTAQARMAQSLSYRSLAWEWLQIEAMSAMTRRKAMKPALRSLEKLFKAFQWISYDAKAYPEIRRLLEKHRLRSADAGHLHALKLAKSLKPDLEFVCFDGELSAAASKEGIKVFAV